MKSIRHHTGWNITFLRGDLEKRIELFINHHNHQRYHENLKNLTPADVYFGRGQSILEKRERTTKRAIAKRRLHYQRHAAYYEIDEQNSRLT